MIGAFQINLRFMKWELVIAAFLLLVAVFIACRKGVKRALVFLLITVAALALAFGVKCMVYLSADDPAAAVRLGVAWGPTVEFAYILFVYTLFGVWRGFRKSTLLLVHAVCAAAVCLGLFFFFTRSAAFDRFLLQTVNKVLGGGGLPAKLGVSEECATLREVFAEWIPSKLNFGTEVSIVLRENGAYLQTLADMAMRVVFAWVCYLLYLFIVFVLYIVYHAAYSERKYKRRKEIAVRENRTDSRYKKHALAGGIVGLVRGFAAGVLSLSLMGAVLFMVADVGKNKMRDLTFENENMDFAYSAIQALEEYGDHGIFRFLNGLRDGDDSPYYLFAADLIFSGRLQDDANNVSGNIKFRKEIAAYTKFARRTADLMWQYGNDDLRAMLSNKTVDNKKDAVLNVLQNAQFQTEFENLIDEFEAQTYLINFALAGVNSLLCHIDETRFASSMSERTRELMKVVFKAGHLSNVIPDERDQLASGKTQGAQPYINVGQVFNKEDAKVLFRMATAFLEADSGEQKDDTLALVRKLLPQMEQLSVLSDERADSLNGVYGRLYCYVANAYLSGGEENGVYYRDVVNAKVSWTQEIRSLVTVAEDGIDLYDAVKADQSESNMDKVLSLFDESAPDYAQKTEKYDRVAQTVSESKLLGQVLQTNYINGKLRGVFSSVSENMYMPANVTYENTAQSKGELHNLLYGFKLLGSAENRKLLQAVIDAGDDVALDDVFALLGGATEHADAFGQTLSDYMVNSAYLRSMISVVMIEKSGDALYVPDVALEQDVMHNAVPFIRKDTLAQMFEACKDAEARNAIRDFLQSEEQEGSTVADVATLIKNAAVANVLDMGNPIIEGSVALQLGQALQDNGKITVPRSLYVDGGIVPDAWFTRGNVAGELRRMVAALRLDDGGEIIDKMLEEGSLTQTDLKALLQKSPSAADTLLSSEVIYYTVSRSVTDGKVQLSKAVLVVPATVTERLPDDGKLIKKGELSALMALLQSFDITPSMTVRQTLKEMANHKEQIGNSDILCSSVAHYILTEQEVANKIYVPIAYRKPNGYATQKEWLEQSETAAVLWRREVTALAVAADLLFDLDNEENELTVRSERLRQIEQNGQIDTVLSSALLVGTMSDSVLKNETLVVPHTVLADNDLIAMAELRALIGAFTAYTAFMGQDGDIEQWNPDWKVPDGETAAAIVHSAVIRATLTVEIRSVNKTSGNADVHVLVSNTETATWVRKTADETTNGNYELSAYGNITVLQEEQMLAMFTALRAVYQQGESTFVIPEVDREMLLALAADRNNAAAFAACDALRWRIGKELDRMAALLPPTHSLVQTVNASKEEGLWLTLSNTDETLTENVLAADKLDDCLDALQEFTI